MIAPDAAVPLASLAAVGDGQGWPEVGDLLVAFALSAAVGLEREQRQKNAGLRTHALVGLGAALFVLVSKYGFFDVLERGRVVLDPSRVAAQIVTGIGFLGAGLIFVKRNAVRGLTTAAAVWVTAAVGAAAGAGLWLLAVVTTGFYFVVTVAFPLFGRWLPAPEQSADLRIRVPGGQEDLRRVLDVVIGRGFVVDEVSSESVAVDGQGRGRALEVELHLHGRHSVRDLAGDLIDAHDVDVVRVGEVED